MFIKRDTDLEVIDDFRTNVKKRLDHHQVATVVMIDDEVAGWKVTEPDKVKVLIISTNEVDASGYIDTLFKHFKSPLSLFTSTQGLDLDIIKERTEDEGITVMYAPDPDSLGSTEDFMSLFVQAKRSKVRLLFSVNSALHEMIGVSPQVVKIG